MTTIKPTEAAESKTFRLSRRLVVQFTVGPAGMVVEWQPDLPDHLTAAELRAYRTARAQMLAKLAEMIGGTVACVEIQQ